MKANEMRRKSKRTLDTERYTSKEYLPYVTAIGQIALAWNDLHESLCSLFVMLTAADDSLIEAAWQSLPSDRAKRGMLRAAIAQLSASHLARNPHAPEEMKWLLGKLDGLEEDRNNAVHAPLSSFSHWSWQVIGSRRPGVQPDDVRFNKRARNLRNKHLLTEYRYVRDAIMLFRDYVEEIESSWNWSDNKNENDPWPERPTLPNRGFKAVSAKMAPTQLRLALKSEK